jgi:hypothetical protein
VFGGVGAEDGFLVFFVAVGGDELLEFAVGFGGGGGGVEEGEDAGGGGGGEACVFSYEEV